MTTRKFKVNPGKEILLSFLTPQDQYDMAIKGPDSGFLTLEGYSIFYTKNGRARESITAPSAIGVWLEYGEISEIHDT